MVMTFEGTVENGQIQLHGDVKLPEHAKVYVVVPGGATPQVARMPSVRLANPDDYIHFEKRVMSLEEGD